MKSLVSVSIVAAEAGLAYIWLVLGYAAAGRVLVFYYWALVILTFLIAGLASHPNFKLPKRERSPRLLRYFLRLAIVVRVLGLVAIDRPVLASFYGIATLVAFLVFADGKPAAPASKEGV